MVWGLSVKILLLVSAMFWPSCPGPSGWHWGTSKWNGCLGKIMKSTKYQTVNHGLKLLGSGVSGQKLWSSKQRMKTKVSKQENENKIHVLESGRVVKVVVETIYRGRRLEARKSVISLFQESRNKHSPVSHTCLISSCLIPCKTPPKWRTLSQH